MSSSFSNKLPPPPPDDFGHSLTPPRTPSKSSDSPASRPTYLGSLPNFEPLSVPSTPVTPLSPISPSEGAKPKKTNPLNDLIDTERAYVDQLTAVIRKVAAAWSSSNLPPSELDTMFRCIQTVYKANRSLLTKLKEIGTNPSSPKALGDLLMRWIDDLETPYSTYCSKFLSGFNMWEPVQSNPKLGPILVNFSSSNPPSSGDEIWTLDTLFLLPKARLKYYKKLYGRLLKSTAPGRSDHRLLVGAVDKLDRLLDTLEQREIIRVGFPENSPAPQYAAHELEDEVVLDMRTESMRSEPERPILPHRTSEVEPTPGSGSNSTRDSGISTGDRMSRETVSTATSHGSTTTLSMPISDLERRLSTARCMDIFSMTHKAVKLQMTPPSLTYTREMRCSVDLVIRITPRATGQEVIHRRGHVFLLSDLFLVCERMSLEERATSGSSGPDMWLCYPPLAGKVLRVLEVPESDTEMQVHIMRKETLTLCLETRQERDVLLRDFKDCIEFASSVGPVSKQAPPPVPPLPGMGGPPRSPISIPSPNRSSPPKVSSSPISRTSSPPSQSSPGMESITSRTSSLNQQSSRSSESGSFSDQFSRMGMPNVVSPPPAPKRLPSFHDQPPASVGIGQVFPVSRNPSLSSQNQSFTPYGPGPGREANGPPLPMKGPMQPLNPGGPPRNMSAPSMQNGPPFNQPRAPFMDGLPPRPPSEPPMQASSQGRRSPSTRSLSSQQDHPRYNHVPPNGYSPNVMNPNNPMMRQQSFGPPLHAPQPRPMMPSATFNRTFSSAEASFVDPSPPNSPVAESSALPTGPVTSSITATFKCKVFLKQQHAQWKSLGSAKLKLYREDPTNVKQLVVEADDKVNTVLISTIVLTDGVERVGKTGVAVELSDRGARTGTVYMIQVRNEKSAGGLFDSLLDGSDRAR
ncbi:hypothetical protein J3R30DRAFT_3445453 [Lentinula aciculospora]|uniref:DH domain-containing protein n=1 Tax=Lentinula aciculospora TaxID=153920 RepID=A0A9W9AQ05_9AGAR|nr:hypothetical protein J3R30DRAFT_3445453 [Lentinula aciculospora]